MTGFPVSWHNGIMNCHVAGPSEPGAVAPIVRGWPAQLFPRRIIELAFADAVQIGSDGLPTARAMEAYEWLTERLDWTLYGTGAPPPALREEFYGSFEWACSWLGENPDRVRECGLPPIHARVYVEYRRPRDHVRGLPDIQRRWTIAASLGSK